MPTVIDFAALTLALVGVAILARQVARARSTHGAAARDRGSNGREHSGTDSPPARRPTSAPAVETRARRAVG